MTQNQRQRQTRLKEERENPMNKMNVQEQSLPPVQMTDLCASRGVTIESTFVAKTKRDNWECFEWAVMLSFQDRRYVTPYYCGIGHAKAGKPTPPSAAAVLASLCSDATSADRTTFEDWCGDLGYDTDSRKAEKMYHACIKTNAELRAFLCDHFDEFAQAEH